MPDFTKSDEGFTLIEVLIATTVLVVGIVGIVGTMSSSFAVAGRTATRAKATALATKHLEEARGTDWQDLAVADDSTTLDERVGATTYHVERSVTWAGVDDQPEAYKQVTVAISWADDAGAHEVHQTSNVYPPGANVTTTTVGATGPVPATPASLVATIPTGVSGGADLAWTPGSAGGRVTRWVVQRSTDNFVTAIVVTDNEPAASRTMRVTGLGLGATHKFRIAAGGADGRLSAWSPVATVTTTASLLPAACVVSNVTVSPATVTRSLPMVSTLLVRPRVVVETSGTCTGFRISYSAVELGNVTLPMAPGGTGVWIADVDATGTTRWDVGQHSIAVSDTLGARKGEAVLVVCDQGASACA